MRNRLSAVFLLAPLALGAGCTENTIVSQPFDSIAVVAGDFDSVQHSLDRLEVSYTVYEGFICCAAYDADLDPEDIGLTAESLFTYTDQEGVQELNKHDAVFVNSGARGFGAEHYRTPSVEDDFLVTDPEVIQRVKDYVELSGRTLVVNDWSYDLIEAAWPDKVDWYGEDTELDAAQVGLSGRHTARVQTEALKQDLGTDTLSAEFNYTNWALVESVAEGVTVHAVADVMYKGAGSENVAEATDVPVLISFEAGQGLVVFSSMHWNTQSAGLADTLLVSLVDGLDPGNALDVEPEDTNADQ